MVKNGTKSGRARFRCAKGREYKPQANPETHESKRRKTSTQFTGCKFQLAARPLPDGRWAVKLPDGPAALHNHGWSDPTAFAGARADALAPFEQEVIKLSNSGSRPAQILAAIQAEQRGIHGQDIINLLQRHRRAELRGRSPLQCLYEDYLKPEASKFVWEDTRDSLGHVISLTIAPKSGLQLLKQNPDLLLLDSTYKTNHHNMPLFNACGVTSGNKTFNWAVTFMSGEKEGDYSCALAALIRILQNEGIKVPGLIVTDRELALLNALNNSAWVSIPHLLCRWHVNMNVLAKARRHFPAATKHGSQYRRHPTFKAFLKEWNALLASVTEDDFNKNLAKFRTPGRHPDAAVDYAVATWIEPWKVGSVVFGCLWCCRRSLTPYRRSWSRFGLTKYHTWATPLLKQWNPPMLRSRNTLFLLGPTSRAYSGV